jgi:hypothetical protein
MSFGFALSRPVPDLVWQDGRCFSGAHSIPAFPIGYLVHLFCTAQQGFEAPKFQRLQLVRVFRILKTGHQVGGVSPNPSVFQP